MKRVLAFVLVLIISLTVAGCSSGTDSKLADIQKNKQLVIYTDPNFPPFEIIGANKEVAGVDIEIGKAIAEELGVSAKFTEANFDSILMAIKGGKGDIAISGMTITEERKKSVDFSEPYIESVQYLILREDSSIKVMEDLAGKKVGVAKGYTGSFLMEDETSVGEDGTEGVLYNQNTELREYNSAMEAALDLKAKRIDAVVMDEYVAKNIVTKNTGMVTRELRYENGDLAAEEYGVVIPKGNEDLVDAINQVIQRLVNEDKIREWVVQFSE